MTKFEEVLNKVIFNGVAPTINEKFYLKSTLLRVFSNWHSDEEFHELSEKLDDTNDALVIAQNSRDEFEREYKKLKSQLQQQALPVVPECVDIWIKKCQELNWLITDALAPEGWESDFAKDTEKWLKESKENFNLLALAFITGKYQVEKPQLFRLKLKNATISNYYLWLNHATGKVFVDKKFLDWTNHDNVKNIFTEQEIAKISDGAFVNNEAFELVPVEEEE